MMTRVPRWVVWPVGLVWLVIGGLAAGCTSAPPERPAGDAAATRAWQPLARPFGLKWNGYGYPAAYRPVIKRFRGGATFHDITWCAVERAPGSLSWTGEDRVVDDALQLGLEVLIRIRIGTCWVNGNAPDPRPRSSTSRPPSDISAYQEFVRTLVRRYSARGVRSYAIENEIDASNYWAADPATYPPVARAGVAAVRAADPQARVADAGLSSSSYGLAVAMSTGDAGFYRAFYARRGSSRLPRVSDMTGVRAAANTKAGRRIMAAHTAVLDLHKARLFDVYQLHYYDPWEQAAGTLGYIRRFTRAPIEAWEAGSFWPSGYDPRQHAAEIAKLATTLLTDGVRRIIYLPLVHTPGVIAPRETWRGLYERSGTPRPAAVMLDRLRDLTSSGTWQAIDRPGVRGALVSRPGGVTFVLWSDGDGRSVHAPDGAVHRISAMPTVIPTSASVTVARRWLETV